MHILQIAFLYILYSSVVSSIIILFILSIKKLFKNRISTKFNHILWFLVLIKLLIPFTFETELNLFNFLNIIEPKIESSSFSSPLSIKHIDDSLNKQNLDKVTPTTPAINSYSQPKDNTLKENISNAKNEISFLKQPNLISNILKATSYIWILGFASILILILTSAFKFKKHSKSFLQITDYAVLKTLNTCKEKLNISRDIYIYYDNNSFNVPFIYGFFSPKIYISESTLKTVDSKQLFHIILHELCHYKRKDYICNLLSTIALILHWFNPLIWFAIRKIREDMELACDTHVLEILEEEKSIEYGMTIIHLSKSFLNNNKNKLLHSYFYENKKQLERRIFMIKRFKQGSYKISAMAIILFILLLFNTLTSSTNSKLSSTAIASIYSNLLEEGKKFKLSSNTIKHFYTLERAKDFVDFKFKAPDYLPLNYELYSISSSKANTISINFWSNFNSNEQHFDFTVSKSNILNDLTSKPNKTIDNVTTDFKKEPMHISNINGFNLIATANWKNTPKNQSNEILDKYFIWEEDGIWYSILYYNKTSFPDGHYSIDELSINELSKIVSTLNYFDKIENINYTSKLFKNSLFIYDEKDMPKAINLLGFSPKFPLELPKSFTPTLSLINKVSFFDNDTEKSSGMQISTTFKLKDTSTSSPYIELNQIKNLTYYNELDSKGYYAYIDYDNKETKKIKINLLNIDNVKVFMFEKPKTKYLPKQTNYVWKQNDICYEISVANNIDNKEEIVRALINEKPY